MAAWELLGFLEELVFLACSFFTLPVILVRDFESFDAPLLAQFLALAAHEEEIETVLANPALAVYVEDWGRYGDCAVVAEEEETGEVVGMAWARFWTGEHRGFGWVDELTPELAIAVLPAFQGRGIGTGLIEVLMGRMSALVKAPVAGTGIFLTQIALNVRQDSPAVRLYERLGFVRVKGSERVNRTGGVSFNMIAPLRVEN